MKAKAVRMGAKVSSGKKEISEKDLAYFTQHTGLQKEQVLYILQHHVEVIFYQLVSKRLRKQDCWKVL